MSYWARARTSGPCRWCACYVFFGSLVLWVGYERKRCCLMCARDVYRMAPPPGMLENSEHDPRVAQVGEASRE